MYKSFVVIKMILFCWLPGNNSNVHLCSYEISTGKYPQKKPWDRSTAHPTQLHWRTVKRTLKNIQTQLNWNFNLIFLYISSQFNPEYLKA